MMHPHYQAIIKAFVASGRPYLHQVTPAEARELLRASLAAPVPDNLPDIAGAWDEMVEGPNGPIPIRRYRPLGGPVGTAVYLHSGGWVIGSVAHADNTCRRLAAGAGCEIVSVDYRLAPEHPFPQPLDDAYAVLEWAASACPSPLALIGESAGGNLAAACAIRARDGGGPEIVAQVLAYPVTDCGRDTASYREIGGKNWLLSGADMAWFWDHYCPPQVDRAHSLVSPLRVADAAGLPPAFVAVAELDPLRDEGLAFAARLTAAGVETVSRRDAGVLHGYWGAAGVVDASTAALDQACGWLRDRLHAASAAHASRPTEV